MLLNYTGKKAVNRENKVCCSKTLKFLWLGVHETLDGLFFFDAFTNLYKKKVDTRG